MGNDVSTQSESDFLAYQTPRKRKQNPSLRVAMKRKEFSGPELNAEDIVITQKISSDSDSSYGAVMRGYCHGLPVAIKVLRSTAVMQNRSILDGFKEEVKIMSEITHPNVCLFLGACFGEEVMLVTELLQGNLVHLMKSSVAETFSLFQRVLFIRDICHGLGWLHSIQIVHLDLKPANILYTEQLRLKVADFGLARIKSVDGYIPGQCGGTPLYAAPEVLRKIDFTDKADVYSFALLVWYILSGEEPFRQFNDWASFYTAVVDNEYRPIIPLHVPDKLVALLQQCWHPQDTRRPPFTRILPFVEYILLDAAIDDPEARWFWRMFFFERIKRDHFSLNKLHTTVHWRDFRDAVLVALKIEDPESEESASTSEVSGSADVVSKKKKSMAPAAGDEVEAAAIAYDRKNADFVSSRPLKKNATDVELHMASNEALEAFASTGASAEKRVEKEMRRRLLLLSFECLRAVLCEGNTDIAPDHVGIEAFGLVCKLFGPLRGGKKALFRMRHIMCQLWFRGRMNAAQAFAELKDKPAGTYLVRISERRGFVLSAVISRAQVLQLARTRKKPMSTRRGTFQLDLSSIDEGMKMWMNRGQMLTGRGNRSEALSVEVEANEASKYARNRLKLSSSRRLAKDTLLEDADSDSEDDGVGEKAPGKLRTENAVIHVAVIQDADGFVHYEGDSKHRCPSVAALVSASRELKRVCEPPRRRYGHLFTPTRATHLGYLDAETQVNPFRPTKEAVARATRLHEDVGSGSALEEWRRALSDVEREGALYEMKEEETGVSEESTGSSLEGPASMKSPPRAPLGGLVRADSHGPRLQTRSISALEYAQRIIDGDSTRKASGLGGSVFDGSGLVAPGATPEQRRRAYQSTRLARTATAPVSVLVSDGDNDEAGDEKKKDEIGEEKEKDEKDKGKTKEKDRSKEKEKERKEKGHSRRRSRSNTPSGLSASTQSVIRRSELNAPKRDGSSLRRSPSPNPPPLPLAASSSHAAKQESAVLSPRFQAAIRRRSFDSASNDQAALSLSQSTRMPKAKSRRRHRK